ncbi:hypothetical protein GE061_019085 [Apolygus lucorum]|uniref:Uncharacterized protein n=1 Tax=Apolygus lucorum TaxID=248454 RepID=A0A6A4JNZ2_APOLU|nr:hypothetical protein GE061_019085 [Apolygus lucorum]
MNVLSVKTNTVLVSKNLAQAQFRCLECHKVFISSRHLEKHAVRRHRDSITNLNGSFTGPQEAFNFNDRKLMEVAGRLENVLSLLETKAAEVVDVRPSTAWVGPSPCASPDNLSPILDGNCRNIYVLPSSEIRKPVSLFTLPKEKRFDEEKKEFGADDAELCQNVAGEPRSECSVDSELRDESIDDQSNVGLVTVERAKFRADSAKLENTPANSKENHERVMKIPTGIGSEHIAAAGALGPLIVDLISKLERVSNEPKRVASSCSQTSPEIVEIAVPACSKESHAPVRQKTVRFSEHPITINDEQDESWGTESESANKDDDGDNCVEGNDENGSCAESVEEEESVDKSEPKNSTSADESSTENCPNRTENDPDLDVAGEVQEIRNESCAEDGCTTKLPEVFQNVEEFKQATPEPEALNPDAPCCSQSPSRYAQTKQKILDLVEKCINDLKQSESGKKSASKVVESTSEVQNNLVLQVVEKKDVEVCDEESDDKREERGIVCVRCETEQTIPGLVIAPSSIICRDGCLDIDDMSGDSYEKFMKRYSSNFLKDRKIIEEQIDMISLACKTSLDSGMDQQEQDVAVKRNLDSALPVPIQGLTDTTRRNQSDTLVCHKDNASGLEKSEYAVLLHHETSQVQNLIDMLLTDLQRWRNAKKDELSQAIRVQLEERLSSNLNLLGIQNKAKTLSDTAMASTSCLLEDRRLKALKGPKSSYFDSLKTAFISEIDRIAKSRSDYPI